MRSVSSIIIFINIIIHCTQYLSSRWREPTANFGNQHNLQISWLSANRQLPVNKLLVVNVMHDFL